MSHAMLADVDLLFVRSVTPVNQVLLHDTPVSFVATATSGSDHLDKPWLDQAGIAYADAIGSNANSVAEYVVSSLLTLSRRNTFALEGKTIGIIGVGHVGSIVARNARLLGMTVLLNDPPRQRGETDFKGVSLEQALSADIVTLHVPLTKSGPDPTWHLLNEDCLRLLKPGSILIQSSRGAVVDNQALLRLLREKYPLTTVLDVWENEPVISTELLARVDIATPHIAGYSWISKVRGTQMVYQSACSFLGRAPAWLPPDMPAGMEPPHFNLAGSHDPLFDAIMNVYSVMDDDRRLRQLLSLPEAQAGPYFDQLRKTYPVRLECSQTRLADCPNAERTVLKQLGFTLCISS